MVNHNICIAAGEAWNVQAIAKRHEHLLLCNALKRKVI